MFPPTCQGLCPAISYARPIQGIRRTGRPNDENATQFIRPKIWQKSTCRSRSCKASTMNSSSANTRTILARSIPGAELVVLPDVSHLAPLQNVGWWASNERICDASSKRGTERNGRRRFKVAPAGFSATFDGWTLIRYRVLQFPQPEIQANVWCRKRDLRIGNPVSFPWSSLAPRA